MQKFLISLWAKTLYPHHSKHLKATVEDRRSRNLTSSRCSVLLALINLNLTFVRYVCWFWI